jgi:hypothetical protein
MVVSQGRGASSTAAVAALDTRVTALEGGATATPLAAENTVNIGTGNGVTVSFAFPDSPVTRLDAVYILGQLQPADTYHFTDTHLVFEDGYAPDSGSPIEVVAFTS